MDVPKLYAKVEEAIKRKNYDFAVEMLKNQILKFNPNDVKARKLLRATVLEKHKEKEPQVRVRLLESLLFQESRWLLENCLKNGIW